MHASVLVKGGDEQYGHRENSLCGLDLLLHGLVPPDFAFCHDVRYHNAAKQSRNKNRGQQTIAPIFSPRSAARRERVEPSKVFPHNLRHLFAVAFYRVSRDIVKLADVLGHSGIETTRIYLMTTEKEHQRQLDRLRLVL
ncbi:MAG: tyrosine-type recombinase/integrase [Oscillospiraceae bacterium]|nr:tyrosine-type recombinase/integrase [Oscillospiraceae bacterium]